MDAKSRDLWENSLPRDMLYQLSVYVLSHQKGSTAAILYPTTASTASRSLIEIREPSSGGTAGCIAIFDRAFSALHSQAIHPLPQVQEVHEALRTAGITLVRP